MRRFIRIAIGFLLTVCLLALVPARAAMHQAGQQAVRNLKGVWYPYKTEQQLPGAGWKLEVFDNDLAVSHTRGNGAGAGGIDVVMYRTPYRVDTAAGRQRLVPGTEAGLTALTFRLEGDRLLLEDGTCGEGVSLKGEWRHSPPRE